MEPPSALQEKLVAIERVEDVAEVVPGRRYEVRCVRATHIAPWFGRWVPILGELHEDREIIKVATEHWHVDWRFVSAALLRDAEDYAAGFAGPKGAIIGLIVSKRALRKPKEEQWRNLECLRLHEKWPATAPWAPALEFHYRKARAKCGVCPHRGIRLEGAPVVEGARVCPGHGLAWDKQTGGLKPRTTMGKSMIRAAEEQGV
jgi:hypothetical protein